MTNSPEATPSIVPPAQERGRSLKWWLIASAAVNLLLLGVIGGGMMAMKRHGGPFGGMRPPAEDFGLITFARTLPEDRRQAIKADLRQARTRLKPQLDSIADARAKAADLLSADAFDKDVLKTALEAVQGEEMKLRGEGLAIFLDQASKLSLEERRSLAELWKKRRQHRGPKFDDDDKK